MDCFFFIELLSLILYFSKYSHQTESPEPEDAESSESVSVSFNLEVSDVKSPSNLSEIIRRIMVLDDMESFIDTNEFTFKIWMRELDGFSCLDDFKDSRMMRNLQLDLHDRELKGGESYVIQKLAEALN